MSPWLTVEASCVNGPLTGVDFTLNGVPRETPHNGLYPVGSYTLVMPAEWRDETGLWYFGSWENGSPDPTRVLVLAGDTEISGTYVKTQAGVGPEPPQRKYRTMTHFVRLTKIFREIKPDRDSMAVAAQAQVSLFSEKIRDLLDTLGVYADLRHQYLAYAEALDKSQREMAWMVDLIREHGILRDRFERRNLDPEVLDRIDQLVIYRTANK